MGRMSERYCIQTIFFLFLNNNKKDNKNLSSELPYKRGELISWETRKMQRAHYAVAMKIQSLARHCILIGFFSSKSRRLSKRTLRGRRRHDSAFPLSPCSQRDISRSLLLVTPTLLEQIPHPPCRGRSCRRWVLVPAASPPSPKLLNLQKCLLIDHAREGLVMCSSPQPNSCFKPEIPQSLLLLGKLLKQIPAPKGSSTGSVGPTGTSLGQLRCQEGSLACPGGLLPLSAHACTRALPQHKQGLSNSLAEHVTDSRCSFNSLRGIVKDSGKWTESGFASF